MTDANFIKRDATTITTRAAAFFWQRIRWLQQIKYHYERVWWYLSTYVEVLFQGAWDNN